MKKLLLLLLMIIMLGFVSCDNGTTSTDDTTVDEVPEVVEDPEPDPGPEPTYDVAIFYDDIEHGVKEWVAEPATGQWYITSGYSYTLTRCWADDAGSYLDNTVSTLTSRSFDLTLYEEGIMLSFWDAYDFEENYDFGYVQYSIDGGSTWVNALAHTGRKYYWSEQNVVLSVGGEADVKIRFMVVTDMSGRRDGWFVDEIKLSGTLNS